MLRFVEMNPIADTPALFSSKRSIICIYTRLRDGIAVLMLVSADGHGSIIDSVIRAGSSLGMQDGKTALDYATDMTELGYQQIADSLRPKK